MFPKPKNQYIYICDLENDQIRSFWPHFQVEHFIHGMDMLRRVYGTLLYGSLCCGIFSELLELGHAVNCSFCNKTTKDFAELWKVCRNFKAKTKTEDEGILKKGKWSFT